MRSLCELVEEAVRRGHVELGPGERLEYGRVRGFLLLVRRVGRRYVELDVSYLLDRCGEGGSGG